MFSLKPDSSWQEVGIYTWQIFSEDLTLCGSKDGGRW